MLDVIGWMLSMRLSMARMVDIAAREMGVDPMVAVCVCQRESGYDPLARGDQGRAVGLWQFHLSTWQAVRREMGLDTDDARTDPIASTHTALWAMAHGWGKHWATYWGCGGK